MVLKQCVKITLAFMLIAFEQSRRMNMMIMKDTKHTWDVMGEIKGNLSIWQGLA